MTSPMISNSTIDNMLSLLPELNEPDAREDGTFYCKFCKGFWTKIGKYRSHLRRGKRCRAIRKAVGLPILEEVVYTCRYCDKEYASFQTCRNHEIKCTADELVISKLEQLTEEPQTTDKN